MPALRESTRPRAAVLRAPHRLACERGVVTTVWGWEHGCGYLKSAHDIELSYVPWYCPRCGHGDKGQWIRRALFTTDDKEIR